MGETTVNAAYMYDEVEEIRNLNKVEGFDPRKYMRVIQQEGQSGKYYLDVAFRKLWFRLKYPEGKIVKKILKLTDQVAIVEARVYLNKNDAEENFISNALAQKYMTADGQFGNKYVELAETAAVGRALSDAGFGLQFADKAAYDQMIGAVTECLKVSEGSDQVIIWLSKERAKKVLPASWNVTCGGMILEELTKILGEKNVRVVQKGLKV